MALTTSRRTDGKAIAFAFHDVIEGGRENSSGFAGRLATRYKLTWDDFEGHLTAIGDATESKPSRVTEAWSGKQLVGSPLFLTFDDGGACGVAIGEALAHRGWYGHFLIPVDYIGRDGFLSPSGIRYMREMGHEIGSHSCSHPSRMTACTDICLLDEWSRSKESLEEILDEPVVVASVPAGYFSRRVASAAAAAGIRFLFTSEPKLSARKVDECLVLGRYRIIRTTTPRTSGGLASASLPPRIRQFAAWNTKKAVKAIAGDAYVSVRRRLS